MLSAELGFRVHSGWTALVVVAKSRTVPEVMARRRLEMVDRGVRGAQQPYHAAKTMNLPDAAAFLDRSAKTAQEMATASVRNVIGELTGQGLKVGGACILLGSGRPTGDLAATLRSHPMIHTAEGHFFREAVRKACESNGLPVLGVKEKDLISRAVNAIHISPEKLHQRISEIGKNLGPPWRQDEKLCTIAGWLLLAG